MFNQKKTIRIVKPVHVLAIAALWFLAAFTTIDRESDKKILQQIFDGEMQNYRSWNLIPGSKAKVAGAGPHGDFITSYGNDIAQKAISSNAGSMPDGAIIVKDNFTKEKEYRSTVVMKKVDGKWFWGLLKPYGQARQAGYGEEGERMDTCGKCHLGAKRDGVYFWKDPA